MAGDEDRELPEAEEAPLERPAFEEGGRVEQTGLALVHEGEYILPAEGSEAVVSPLPSGAALGWHIVNYHFPVEVEVVGELTEAHMRSVAEFVYDELDTAFKSRR
jgi:hypothetical protein